jgi:hypothetical protein
MYNNRIIHFVLKSFVIKKEISLRKKKEERFKKEDLEESSECISQQTHLL